MSGYHSRSIGEYRKQRGLREFSESSKRLNDREIEIAYLNDSETGARQLEKRDELKKSPRPAEELSAYLA
jgi:hypothetical protein